MLLSIKVKGKILSIRTNSGKKLFVYKNIFKLKDSRFGVMMSVYFVEPVQRTYFLQESSK